MPTLLYALKQVPGVMLESRVPLPQFIIFSVAATYYSTAECAVALEQAEAVGGMRELEAIERTLNFFATLQHSQTLHFPMPFCLSTYFRPTYNVSRN